MGDFFLQRRIGEDLLLECIQQTMKLRGGSVVVWGCISCGGIGPITKVDGRMNGKDYIIVLSRHLLPYMQSMGSSYVFMDDNAPCHQSQAVIWWIFKCFQTFGRYCIYKNVNECTTVCSLACYARSLSTRKMVPIKKRVSSLLIIVCHPA